MSTSFSELEDLLLLTHYLDIESLYRLLCIKVACDMKSKTPEENEDYVKT